jgi:hypothetical protein
MMNGISTLGRNVARKGTDRRANATRRTTRDLERSEVAAALAGRADVGKTSPESRKIGESVERMVGGEVAKLGS